MFPADANGDQTSTTPEQVNLSTQATNVVTGVYVNDLCRLGDALARMPVCASIP